MIPTTPQAHGDPTRVAVIVRWRHIMKRLALILLLVTAAPAAFAGDPPMPAACRTHDCDLMTRNDGTTWWRVRSSREGPEGDDPERDFLPGCKRAAVEKHLRGAIRDQFIHECVYER